MNKLFLVGLMSTVWSVQAGAANQAISCWRPDYASTGLNLVENGNDLVLKLSSNYTSIISSLDTPWKPAKGVEWTMNTTEVEIVFSQSECKYHANKKTVVSCLAQKADIVARQIDWRTKKVLTETKTPVSWVSVNLNEVTTTSVSGTETDTQLAVSGYTKAGESIQNNDLNWHFSCNLVP